MARTFGKFIEEDLSCIRRISGSSLTIPGQSKDLGALLASSKFSGGMIPRHGTPQYDEDENHALARLKLEAMDDEQISQIAESAARNMYGNSKEDDAEHLHKEDDEGSSASIPDPEQ